MRNAFTMPTWTGLRALGTSSVLKSSYFWIFFVPLVAKFLHQIEGPFRLHFAGKDQSIALALPFNWTLFYFASLSFAIASLMFSVFCPWLIKNFDTFSAYYESGCGALPLSTQIVKLRRVFLASPEEGEAFKITWNSLFQTSGVSDPLGFDIDQDFNDQHRFEFHVTRGLLMVKRAEMGDLFYTTYSSFDRTFPLARSLACGSYAIGFTLMFVILVHNFIAVLRMVYL